MARVNQEFVRTDTTLIGNPHYRNIDTLPGQATELFQVVNADGAGRYKVYMAWKGSGSISLVNSAGSTVVSPQNGGDWQGSLSSGQYQFKISGSATAAHCGIERVN
jgi:hypothetical protein